MSSVFPLRTAYIRIGKGGSMIMRQGRCIFMGGDANGNKGLEDPAAETYLEPLDFVLKLS